MTVLNNLYFKEVIKPYLNKCNSLKNLSNLRDKITNIYISKGYITSRAYFKPQDLKSGVFNIYILEGRIEDIISDDINLLNLYPKYKNNVLDLVYIENIITQAQRLRSQNLDVQFLPGTKEGYTIIKIYNKSQSNAYFGSLGINNFGTKRTGIYQISNNLGYENLFKLNDILTLNLNSTDRIFKNNNKTIGLYVNESLPAERFLFDIFYSYSNYKQVVSDTFLNNYTSNGENSSFGINSSFNLLSGTNNTIDILLNYENKKTKNLLDDIELYLQSYSTSYINTGIKYSFDTNSFQTYIKFLFQKGVDGKKDEIAIQNLYYSKYIMDFGITKYFNTQNNLKYNMYARGQYSEDILFGTEEISMGGVYSVRGFNEEGLSGNTGLYVRNDISVDYRFFDFAFSPYIGFDYGYTLVNENNYGGQIYGASVGNKFFWKNLYLETFYTMPLKASNKIKENNSKFFGANIIFNY